MFSICPSPRLLVPHFRVRKENLWISVHPNKKITFISSTLSSSSASSPTNDEDLTPTPKQTQSYDPSEDLFGLDDDLQLRRNAISGVPKLRSWFGPNGQYIRELPCPSCRARGYTPCTECGIERSRIDCSQCNGKGMRTCRQCSGDRVIWEESIDERPWERARSISPLKVKDDDEVDNLDIKLNVRRKSKRVYQPPSPEVGLKISRSLKTLNAQTGLFSKHMKILHRDPKLEAQRVAAIKKTKRTPEARKQASEFMTAFFSDPENRRKRSITMKGQKIYYVEIYSLYEFVMEPPHQVLYLWIGGDGVLIEVFVEYPWKPPICEHCQAFGHYSNRCIRWEENTKHNSKPTQHWKIKGNEGKLDPKEAVTEENVQSEEGKMEDQEQRGDWSTVTSKRKGKKKKSKKNLGSPESLNDPETSIEQLVTKDPEVNHDHSVDTIQNSNVEKEVEYTMDKDDSSRDTLSPVNNPMSKGEKLSKHQRNSIKKKQKSVEKERQRQSERVIKKGGPKR
ncbi:hypothetical protein GIB67_005038 [Kingdonia uniflora]|uniref:Uncharacterized protein n=1 Tax=Kingdonia uniflora TaxID=39325 RepID=A0A7J7NMW0_9MAGN|nr:hypothetical protein GIB67_005038 [Kingdonia uniflora]